MTAFDNALTNVLRHEGQFSNDARDPGGETKFGISKKAYPDLDIPNLTVREAATIYRRDYWTPIKGDQMPEPIAIAIFDAAVNMGVDRAIRIFQQSMGIKVDGILGVTTLKFAARADALSKFTAQRILAYTGIRNFDLYGRGWIIRAVETALEAKA